ncbi:MAG: hypothetical protein ABIH39_04355 [Candidatus Margulisiibacteriota bacterium]
MSLDFSGILGPDWHSSQAGRGTQKAAAQLGDMIGNNMRQEEGNFNVAGKFNKETGKPIKGGMIEAALCKLGEKFGLRHGPKFNYISDQMTIDNNSKINVNSDEIITSPDQEEPIA